MRESVLLFLVSILCIKTSSASSIQEEEKVSTRTTMLDKSLPHLEEEESTSSKKQVMFIRHGNYLKKTDRCSDGSNSCLSEKGRQQVSRLKPYIKSFDPDLIVSSPILRCRQTTEILLSEKNVNIIPHYDIRFKERVFPSLYDLSFEEIKERYGQDKFYLYQKESEKLELEGDETMEQAKKRVATALKEYLKITKNRMAVISHGGPHSWILCDIFNIDNKYIRHFTLGEARLSLFEFNSDGTPSSVISMNAGDEPHFYLNTNESLKEK